MKKLIGLFVFLLIVGTQIVTAQSKQITGTVTSADDGLGMPGVSVVLKGTTIGASTDIDGKYSLEAKASDVLIFSFVGMVTKEIKVGEQTVINMVLETESIGMDEVVVTALGITREKKSLGYASQAVTSEEVTAVKTDNVVNALSGKVAGVQIKRNTNMGGSTNILIRGNTSLTGDNQALFVVDGVPMSNANLNGSSQQTARGGYDYGNFASDINADDVESINVLKGAAATALYGSRAANGAIIITTKKGSKGNKVEITVNSGITIGSIDKSTFPEYQKQYGSGYGPYYGSTGDFDEADVDGDGTVDLIVPLTEDASFGGKFDPNLNVFHWNSLDPASEHYLKKRPWVAAKNGPIEFFETPVSYSNNVSMSGSTDTGNYRFSYTNFQQNGLMPNSDLERNTFALNASSKLTDKLTVSAGANYVLTDAKGRNETGYSDNMVSSFRQWWQTNVDVKELENIYHKTKRNVTWNPSSYDDPSPIYWDNPYWARYENYETDTRNRFFGNMALNYKINDWLTAEGKVSVDTYSYIQEERINNGSNPVSKYTRYEADFTEKNYDFMLSFNKDLTERINLNGVVGVNKRRTSFRSIYAETNGGLIVDRLFAISNSQSVPLAPTERATEIGVDGIYGMASFGYDKTFFVDVTARQDHSSTLPSNESKFFYPSVATSMIFSEFVDVSWLSFGKIRANYAEVGSSADFARISDVLTKPSPFGSTHIYSINSTKNNPNLKPERTKSIEAGLEMHFFNKRFGFDFSWYKTNSEDQIMPVSISRASGYSSKYVNAGEIENRGVELTLFATPVKTKDFQWDVNVNFAKNKNEVISLFEDVKNLQLGSFQGGITINATIGESYGTIQGSDFVYTDGQRTITSSGYYMKSSTTDNVIGNMNPDWNGGISNKLRYKNFNLSFLIDIQKGGDIFSLDTWYGNATGLYANSVGKNARGIERRETLANGGGVLFNGVQADGSKNTVYGRGDYYGNGSGYARAPNALHIYDASYIKLREVAFSYTLPSNLLKNTFISSAQVSVVGSNLWIIHKNLPYADPEAGLSSGNLQGYQSGVMPTTRDIGVNVKIKF
ncbi:SusC/RagA family TonB-linked outer membrane protein [Ancylomarina euxinus]|uniref:SusC/RagA family TonB-linked outer membrane protein n=1 Tax=Ancylomarina euxinus TaxID=2283627 RepID=A0A425XXE9_9BACT|nr:SusC/RagA family TonB-linked outer membrane protein [Ancylomarina euxinus]MCZ4696102.1 SusC/RagA family TonB-linked outer membrane protein [Ancylomarina euxinus]MUP16511.1 SusC/RagA family TonB-linked outer membrane protein [Ancylomarina euxinus]RRG19339.1 SusC/RagA family TonB-linked outer membrane protein [Ancylomarina euxinus]